MRTCRVTGARLWRLCVCVYSQWPRWTVGKKQFSLFSNNDYHDDDGGYGGSNIRFNRQYDDTIN